MNNKKTLSNKYFVLMLLGIVAIFSALCFVRMTTPNIFVYDEARHAVSAYEMIKNHNYLINTYMNQPDYWNLKPVLAFWYLIPSYKIFGFTEFATRFPSIICGYIILTIILVYTYRHYKREYVIISGLLFCCSNYFFFNHGIRTGNPEGVYLLFFVSAMVCLLESNNNKYLYIPYFFFTSLAFLTKSFHALILLIIGFIYYILAGDFKKLKWYIYPLSIIALFLFPSIWAYERYKFDGNKFFTAMVDDLFNRGGSSIEGHTGTIFYYCIHILSVLAFWVALIVGVYILVRIIKKKGFKLTVKISLNKLKNTLFKQTHLEGKLLWIWFLTVFIFYSIFIKSKLDWYMLPAYIPLILISVRLIKYCFNKNLLFKTNKQNKTLFKVSISIPILYSISIFLVPFVYHQTNNGAVSLIKPVVTNEQLSKYKGKELYLYTGSWDQGDVFYIETNNFIPKNEGLTGHKSSLNSLYCIDTKLKDQYILDNPGEVLVFTNTTYSVFIN